MRVALTLLLALIPSALLAAEPIKPPAVAPVDLQDWTPRPAVGKGEPWEKMKDPDWDETRFRSTNTGPTFNCTFKYPNGKDQVLAYKATAIRMGNAAVAFDRNTGRMVTGWSGGYLNISQRRFGLLNTPTPNGTTQFALPAGPGWADTNGYWDAKVARYTAPLPKEWFKYEGLYLHDDRVVLKYRVNGVEVLDTVRAEAGKQGKSDLIRTIHYSSPGKLILETNAGPIDVTKTQTDRKEKQTITLVNGQAINADADDFEKLTKPGSLRWGKPLVTKLLPGSEDSAYAIDTLTIPYENPFHALFFCTAVEVMPDNRIAVSTAHGDVWLVKVDETKKECHWQRYATGLYQPLGLKLVDGKLVVLERGQLTRLHDENNDGEADFYECINNDWHCSGGEHSYDTSLETDPEGNFYFHKTGDTDTPTGGCLMRVSKDGSKSEIFATGFRHPIGLGMSPTGIVTGADQEGNWMPATRIDQYKQGGFYGDMRAHHRAIPPKTYDGPLCWLPREMDNSAGCQVWVPNDPRWGAIAGMPIHFSYGRCKAVLLLRQAFSNGVTQAGVADLGWRFLSGSRTGKFHPRDAALFVVGLNGWQTAAKADGSLQRVRPTGKPLDIPFKMEVIPEGVKLTFARPLDPKSVADTNNYRAAQWNYIWSGDYGSKRWKVSNPKAEGQDDLVMSKTELSEDGKTVTIHIQGGVKPVMQMQVGYNLKSSDQKPVIGSVYLTVHQTSNK
jgi:hypothetical protein